MAETTHLIGVGYQYDGTGEAAFVSGADRVAKSAEKTSASWSKAKGEMVGAAVSIAASMGAAVYAAAKFETALTGVGKTTNLQGEALRQLGVQADAISQKIPVAATDLLGLAQAAGQLGVRSEDVLKFATTVAKLGTASDLAGEEAAQELARLLTVSGETAAEVDRLAAVVVGLGNNMAATESQIVHHAGEVARSLAVYEIGSTTATAMGATLAALGVRAELSGSAVARGFRTIENAVKTGGEELRAVAAVAKVSAEEMSAAFSRSPVEAFDLLLGGIRQISEEGGNVAAALDSIGLSGEEVLKVLPTLAKNTDLLAQAYGLAGEQARNATALEEEFARASATTEAQVAVLGNQITSASRVFGEALLPSIREVVGEMSALIQANRDTIASLGEGTASGLSAALVFVKDNLDLVKIAATALVAVKVASWAQAAVLAMTPWTAAILAAAAATALLVSEMREWGRRSDQATSGMVQASSQIAAAARETNEALGSGSIEQMAARYEAISAEVEKLEGAQEGLKSQVDGARTSLSQYIDVLGAGDARVADAQDRLNELSATLQENRSSVRELKEQQAELEKGIATATVATEADTEANRQNVVVKAELNEQLVATTAALREQISQAQILADAAGKGAEAERKAAREVAQRNAAIAAGIRPTKDASTEIERLAGELFDLEDRTKKATAAAQAWSASAKEAAGASSAWRNAGKDIDPNNRRTSTDGVTAGILSSLEEEIAAENRMTAARRAGGAALAEAIVQERLAEVVRAAQQKGVKDLSAAEKARAEAAIRQSAQVTGAITAEADAQKAAAAETAQAWIAVLANIAAATDEGVAAALRNIGQVVAGMQQLAEIRKANGGKNGYSAEGIMAGYQVGSSIGALGVQYGAWEGNLGTSQWGGSLGGDKGDDGAALGGAIGSAFGPWGALIGGAIGGLIGGAIDRGVDEATVVVSEHENRAFRQITEYNGKLLAATAALGDGVKDSINAMVDRLGGELVSMGNIRLHIKGDTISVATDTFHAYFKDMDDAINAAVIEGLRSSEISGLSEEAQAALQNTSATTIEGLLSDLDFASWVEGLRLGEAGTALRDWTDSMDAAIERANQLKISTDALYRERLDGVRDYRDQIVGIERDEYQERLAQAREFNEWLAKEQEEANAKLARLMEDLREAVDEHVPTAEVDALRSAVEVFQQQLEDGIVVPIEQTIQQIAVLAEAAGMSTAEIERQIAELRQYIQDIGQIAPIKPEEVRRRNGGGAAAREARERQIEEGIEALERLRLQASGVADSVIDLREGFAEFDAWIEDLRKLKFAEEQLAQARRDQVAVIERDFLDGLRGGTGGQGLAAQRDALLGEMDDALAQAFEIAKRSAEVNGTEFAEELERISGEVSGIFAERLNALFGEAIQGAVDAGDGQALADAVNLLREMRANKDGLLSAKELDELLSRAEAGFGEIADTLMEGHRAALDAAEGISSWERQLLDATDAFDETRERLQGLIEAARSAGVDTTALEQALVDLGVAQSYTIQQIGVDFLGSLTALGVSLPTEVVLELAQAQFNLAQAQAVSAAMALAAAGAFEGLSFTLEDLLGWITDIEFEDSPFFPTVPSRPPSAPPPSAGGESDDDRRRREIEALIERWLALGDEQNIRPLREIHELYQDALRDAPRLGISVTQLATAHAAAVEDFWDNVLGPFEDAEALSIPERVADINSQFDQLVAAAQQYGGDLERIEEARLEAIRRLWDESLEGVRELRDELAGGGLGGVNPRTALDNARTEVERLAELALAGDASAIESIPGAIVEYLDLLRNFSGGGALYQSVVAEMQALLNAILALPGGGVVAEPPPRPPVIGPRDDAPVRPGGGFSGNGGGGASVDPFVGGQGQLQAELRTLADRVDALVTVIQHRETTSRSTRRMS